MKEQLKQVEIFQKAFNSLVNDKPTLISEKDFALRYDLMDEENTEYLDACVDGDLVEVADALGDMLYILCGTIISHGMQHIIEDVFKEIQLSNMSKLDDNGRPIINGKNGVSDTSRPIGKVLKSKNYFRPNIAKFL